MSLLNRRQGGLSDSRPSEVVIHTRLADVLASRGVREVKAAHAPSGFIRVNGSLLLCARPSRVVYLEQLREGIVSVTGALVTAVLEDDRRLGRRRGTDNPYHEGNHEDRDSRFHLV